VFASIPTCVLEGFESLTEILFGFSFVFILATEEFQLNLIHHLFDSLIQDEWMKMIFQVKDQGRRKEEEDGL